MMKLTNLGETLGIAILIGLLLLALSSYQEGSTRHIGSHHDAANDTVIEQMDRSSNRIKVNAEPDKLEPSVSPAYF